MSAGSQLLSSLRCIAIRALTGCGLVLALTTISSGESARAQDFLVRNWDVDDGLPSTCINAIARTRDGYVWLATRHGLARFDGIRFVVFNWDNTPALGDNRIISLATDRQGILWIGTESGNLTRYEEGKFTAVDLGNATHQSSILSIAVDQTDNLWLATDGSGLIQFSQGKVKNFTTTNGLSSLNVWQVLTDPKGGIWYVAAPGNLGWLAAGETADTNRLGNKDNLPAAIRTIAQAQDGGLWLAAQKSHGTGSRIFKLKDTRIQEEPEALIWPQTSARSVPSTLLEDQAGNLWCGTQGEGVFFRPAGGEWQKLAADLSFSQAETMCLTEAEGATVWIGTRTTGLHQAVARPMTTYYLPAANRQNVILTVCVRHDGSVWGGTDGSGLFCWTNPTGNTVGEPNDLAGLHINALLEDSRSNFWAGTSAGLFHYQRGQFELYEKVAGHNPVSALYEDPQGELWAGTRYGLVDINDPKHKKFNRNSGLPSGTILAITENPIGRLWVAIENQGVFRQNGQQFEHWSPPSIAAETRQHWGNGGNVRGLLPDADGSVWAITHGGGLFRLQGERIRNWTWEVDGLPSNHHFALLADSIGDLWFSSENGIIGYAKKDLLNYRTGKTPPPVPWRLTQVDGLPYKVCSGGGQPAATESADGRLWFPDGSAIVAFDPTALPRHLSTWPPIIEEARVDGQLMPATADAPFCIRSGVRSLEFYFTSPNTRSPTQLRFRYRLDGLDRDWVAADARRSAQYSRLPPGDYRFRVMVCDNYGVWNEKAAELQLTVMPRFWETLWFRIGGALLLLGGAGFAARQIERARSRRKLAALERERALEHERSRIARDIHDDLGASLTEVALLGDMAGANSGSPDELREQTKKISAAAREMTQSLEAIVWAVRPENDSLRSLVEYMNRRTDELFEKIPRQYQFIVPTGLPECTIHAEVRHNVFLAYKEALTNSLKYAQATMVRIELACDPTGCEIIIADNGKGFEIGTGRAGGTGIKNMRQRMAEIGGAFSLESKPGQGTTVRLQFPLPHQNKH